MHYNYIAYTTWIITVSEPLQDKEQTKFNSWYIENVTQPTQNLVKKLADKHTFVTRDQFLDHAKKQTYVILNSSML